MTTMTKLRSVTLKLAAVAKMVVDLGGRDADAAHRLGGGVHPRAPRAGTVARADHGHRHADGIEQQQSGAIGPSAA